MALRDRIKAAWRGFASPPPTNKRTQQYLGAAVGNLTRITAPNLSADRSAEQNIRDLVKNSRDLVRNNGYAKRFLRMARNNIAGPKGIAIRPINTFQNGNPNDRVNDAITAAFREWCKPQFCSTNGRLSWLQIQRLMVAEWFTTGDGCLQIVYDPANPFGISLQPFDSDRLDRDFNREAAPGRNAVRYGVELDPVGRVIGYHVLRVHPSEIGWARANAHLRDFIPADQIIHLYTQDERVDLTRGIPHLAVAMRALAHLGEAEDASLIALKTNAINPAFIETAAEGEVDDPPDGALLQLTGEAGDIPYLGRGQRVATLDPNVPQDNLPDFGKFVLRDGAVGLGTSYAFLAGDWSDANFASMRVGRQDETDEWIAHQEHFICTLVQPVFEAWLRSAMLKGRIPVPDYDLTKANRVAYQGRRWISPKPLEDVEVYERRIALGIDSRKRIVAAEGGELWDVWDDLAEEQQYAQEKQLNVEPPRKAATPTPIAERPPADGEPATPDETKPSAAKDRSVLRLARSGV